MSADLPPLPKYARYEHERRWLVPGGVPGGLQGLGWQIEDRYLDAGRLRLRAITDEGSGEVTHKLGKKWPEALPGSGALANLYLSAAEHAALAASLPGRTLTKRRLHDRRGPVPFAVDVFAGPLEGLVLCEAEVATREALEALVPPAYAGPEVTADPLFRGGALCDASPRDLARALARALERLR